MRRAGALLTAAAIGLAACDDAPTGPAPAGALSLRAFNFADWTAWGYASAEGGTALDEIADAGANAVVFVYTIYQETRTSSDPRVHPTWTPAFAALGAAFAHARSLGLEVILKVHVDVLDGSWRGFIDPSSPDSWFAAYGDEVGRLAAFAEGEGVSQLVVGTELVRTLSRETEWRALISAIRGVFAGDLCYAASWDEVERVPFWDALDVIGVDFWFPLTGRTEAGRMEMLAGWQPWLDRLDAFRRRLGRGIVLTEIGYMSRDGAGMAPADYRLDAPIDLEEQEDLYWAALTAVAGEEWIEGVVWWNWTLRDEGGPADGGYTPRGKPALDVLRAAWRGSG